MMSIIEFTNEEKSKIVDRIKVYFDDKLDQEIGQFDAEFLLDFFSNEIGAYYYNRGLNDAKVILTKNLDNIDDQLYEIEKPTEFQK